MQGLKYVVLGDWLNRAGRGSGIEGGTGERLIPGMEGVVTGGDSTKLGKKMMESMGLPRGTNWTVNRRISKRRN